MAGIVPMEIRTDTLGEKLYASRNHNHLRHTYVDPGANRTQIDWNLTLRQRRKPMIDKSASVPNLPSHCAALAEGRQREPLAPGHPDGPYHNESPTLGKYQNYANTSHMLERRIRRSGGAAQEIDWQLNLRGGLHQREFEGKWRRHYARPQRSFDMMKENCAADNDAYQNSQITPQDRRPDRREGAISIATIRDDPISFRRWPGCEGTEVGAWRHLVDDRSRGYKARRHIAHEVTLRENKNDPNGARITDNRSSGCIVEMMGKKKWAYAKSHDPLKAHWPTGDAKMYHLSQIRNLAEADEESRALRKARHPRTDDNIPEVREPLRHKED
eukprot:TRINITY_DN3121_c0_g4_i1.p1 TRINITY_DN3121_c0_g4~~TRINITY_DN3121_c0_g4_i1.p1  ORF type:complete len:329 (+),score=42.72 TRINITY_DN3121_c0_g4_i1:121-1107(+)